MGTTPRPTNRGLLCAVVTAVAVVLSACGTGATASGEPVPQRRATAAVGPDSVGQPGSRPASGSDDRTGSPDSVRTDGSDTVRTTSPTTGQPTDVDRTSGTTAGTASAGVGEGSDARAVTQVQLLLVARGVVVPVDGVWPGPTEQAVVGLRRAAGLGGARFDDDALDALDALHPPAPTTTAAPVPVPAPVPTTSVPAPAGVAPGAAATRPSVRAPGSACSVSLVGDSLVAIFTDTYRKALERAGCTASVDGLSSRSLTDGRLCAGKRCGAQGLEVLRGWARDGSMRPTVVVALGTNDAGIGGPTRWRASWADAMELTAGRTTVFVTPVGRGRTTAKREQYSAELRTWCARNGCAVADWAADPAAKVAGYYADDVHLNAEGSKLRAAFIAAAVS